MLLQLMLRFRREETQRAGYDINHQVTDEVSDGPSSANMVILGGSDHARYRALSVPVGPEVAVDRESCGVERQEAVRGGVGRASGRRVVVVSQMCAGIAALRPRRGADLASSGQLPV